MTPKKKEIIEIIFKIFKLFNPLNLKISNSLASINLVKKNCVLIKKIKGNISKRIEGVFNRAKKEGKKKSILISLKNCNSSSIVVISTTAEKIIKILIKHIKKRFVKNLIYVFIFSY